MNREWLRLEHGGMTWRVLAGEERRILGRDWTVPEKERSGLQIVQRWGSRVSGVWSGSEREEGALFVKWYGLRHALEGVKYAFKDSRPAAEWRMNRMLAQGGSPVVDCLALGEKRIFGWWRKGVLVTRAISPCTTLGGYLKTAPWEEAVTAVRLAADLVARFHARGGCHHDLHGDNVLVKQRQGGPIGLLLTDLHETTMHRRLTEAHWTDDLARLNGYTPGSRGLRMRFWFRYAAARGLDRREFRRWLARIDGKTRALWNRHRKKRGANIELY